MSVLLIVGAEMYAGRVACCPRVSHGEYADGTDRRTDGRTPYRYIKVCAKRGQCHEQKLYFNVDDVEIFAMALLLMCLSMLFGNKTRFSMLEQIVLVYRTLSECQVADCSTGSVRT